MKIIVLVVIFAIAICSVIGSNDLDPEFSVDRDSVDYYELNEIRQLCAEKYGTEVYYFSMFYYSDEAPNRTIQCAGECEMKSRKFIDGNGELDKERFTEEYYREVGVKYSNYTKIVADYVLKECFKQWAEDENTDSCAKAFNFQRCLVRQQQEFYSMNNVRNCLYDLQGKNVSDDHTRVFRGDVYNSGCITMATYCYMDIQNYVQSKGVDKFNAIVEETGLLEDEPDIKYNFIYNLRECHDNREEAGEEDCHRDIKFFTCMVTEFQQIMGVV